MTTLLVSLGALVLSAFTFLIGRSMSESEKILAEKRRVYEDFLRNCPVPNDAYDSLSEQELIERSRTISRLFSVVALYGSPAVVIAIGRYIEEFGNADQKLDRSCPPLHEAYRKVAKAHNDVILEMSRDAMAWSMFGYKGPSRLPKDALENAKRNNL